MARQRADALLAERGLAPSRTDAAASIRAGTVRLGRDGPRLVKPSQLVADDADLVVEEGRRYASRGGLKLERALEALGIDVTGRDCLDVGASTGGFTDCLLQRGAARVIALDVGHGQLDWPLRNDRRVEVMERVNARDLRPSDLSLRPDLATIDVSFISLAKVLPAVAACLAPEGQLLALVKPQFELGRGPRPSCGVSATAPGFRIWRALSRGSRHERRDRGARGDAHGRAPHPLPPGRDRGDANGHPRGRCGVVRAGCHL
jgi:23S rRNA (cytidine1920-2'-O)/16S rRNA (cytidine1409-2'-O)-methyltransferase